MRRSRLQPPERSNFDVARPGSGCSAALQGDRERRERARARSLLYRRVRRCAQVGVEGGRSVGGHMRPARVSLVSRAFVVLCDFIFLRDSWLGSLAEVSRRTVSRWQQNAILPVPGVPRIAQAALFTRVGFFAVKPSFGKKAREGSLDKALVAAAHTVAHSRRTPHPHARRPA